MIRTLDFLWIIISLIAGGWLSIIDPQADMLLVWVDHHFLHYLIFVLCGPVWFMVAIGLHLLSERWGI